MKRETAVDFPGTSRVHIALAVTDLERSRRFYELLLGVPPSKVRDGYAKFEPRDPSINLTLNAVVSLGARQAAPAHFGIQVRTTEAVREAIEKLNGAGLATDVESGTTCCYAVQDKVWVDDPDGNSWEVFVVTEADTEQHSVGSPRGGAPDEAASGPSKGCC